MPGVLKALLDAPPPSPLFQDWSPDHCFPTRLGLFAALDPEEVAKADRVDAAVVVHGTAGWEMLDDEAYRARHGVDNPNAELIRELTAAGVEIILCGQTASARGIPRDGVMDEVQIALSAMTAFLVLQDQGFRVNPW